MYAGVRALGMAVALLLLAACSEEKALGPTTQEFNKERQALVAKLDKGKAKRKAGAQKAGAATAVDTVGFSAGGADFSYEPAGRRDPFRSFEWEYMKREFADSTSRGPLEQYDLGQLALVGVVWHVGRARALVQDPSGMSYVVAAGARMGKNEGVVTRIDDNLVVVRERYVDLYNNEAMKDVEMRIRATDGG